MAGMPTRLIDALIEQGARNLTIVSNNAGNGDTGLAALLAAGRVDKVICSFPRQADSHVFDGLYRAGRVQLEVVHILISHTHWDHIQGLPFFWLRSSFRATSGDIYGPRPAAKPAGNASPARCSTRIFRSASRSCAPRSRSRSSARSAFAWGRIARAHSSSTTPRRLSATAWTAATRSIAYITDHEPFWWEEARGRQRHRFVHPGEERHLAFVAGVDVLIHDAQYADSEYPARRGWGHSTMERRRRRSPPCRQARRSPGRARRSPHRPPLPRR